MGTQRDLVGEEDGWDGWPSEETSGRDAEWGSEVEPVLSEPLK